MANILAFDIGEKRVGVAIADAQARFSKPLTTLLVDESISDRVAKLIEEHEATEVVFGYPRDAQGVAGQQAKKTEDFVSSLELPTTVRVAWQDETLTSVKAEQELEVRGNAYEKGDIDSLAAHYILEDYLGTKA